MTPSPGAPVGRDGVSAPDPAEDPELPRPARAPGLLGRLLGVIHAPTETFRQAAHRPRPFATLAIVTVVSALAAAGFFATEVGRNAWLDTTIRQQEAFGATITDAQYALMERIAGFLAYIVLVQVLILGPLINLFVAWIFKAGFAVFAGAEATFQQTLDVIALSGVILVLRGLFTLPLNYAMQQYGSPSTLAAFVPMLPADSVAVRFLGMIDVFIVWWVAVLAIGLAVLFRRHTGPIALSLFTVYAVVAVGWTALLSFVGG